MMKPKLIKPYIAALALAVGTIPVAPAFAEQPLMLRSSETVSSHIEVRGTSNVRDWDAESTRIEGALEIGNAESRSPDIILGRLLEGEIPEVKATVRIPAQSLTSSSRRLTANMHGYMNVSDYPYIIFELRSIESIDADEEAGLETGQGLVTRVTGSLSVSGQSRETSLPVVWVREDGFLRLSGEVELKMSDFGIDPPTMMLGALRTADEVMVSFHWVLEPRSNQGQ